ncbi:MAG: hypothetical protein R6X33_10185 [Candidatus Brocadiia bacterium]
MSDRLGPLLLMTDQQRRDSLGLWHDPDRLGIRDLLLERLIHWLRTHERMPARSA